MNQRQDYLRILKIISIVFCLVGIVFTAIGGLTLKSTRERMETFIPVTAEITDFDRDDYPYISYTVDGKTYETRLGYSSTTMRLGQKIEIAYDPENPYEVIKTGAGGYLLPIIFGGMGILFVLIGILVALARRRAKEKEEQDNGFIVY